MSATMVNAINNIEMSRTLTSHPPTLEQLFLRHYGDELEAEGLPADGA